jgi:hypothetical protein
VVDEFGNSPSLASVPQKHRRQVLDALPTTLPLPLLIANVDDEGFW